MAKVFELCSEGKLPRFIFKDRKSKCIFECMVEDLIRTYEYVSLFNLVCCYFTAINGFCDPKFVISDPEFRRDVIGDEYCQKYCTFANMKMCITNFSYNYSGIKDILCTDMKPDPYIWDFLGLTSICELDITSEVEET